MIDFKTYILELSELSNRDNYLIEERLYNLYDFICYNFICIDIYFYLNINEIF